MNFRSCWLGIVLAILCHLALSNVCSVSNASGDRPAKDIRRLHSWNHAGAKFEGSYSGDGACTISAPLWDTTFRATSGVDAGVPFYL